MSRSCTCRDFSENDEVEVKAAKKTQASSGRVAACSSTSIYKVKSLEASSGNQLGTCLPESCRNSSILSMESGGTRCASCVLLSNTLVVLRQKSAVGLLYLIG